MDSGDTSFFGADHWRMTSDYSLPNNLPNVYDLSSNWERADSTASGYLGTGMTESSGIFTFPSTGIYLIRFDSNVFRLSGDFAYANLELHVTTDNSSYTIVSRKPANAFQGSGYSSMSGMVITDVTDTSLVKVKMRVSGESSGITFQGETDISRTGITFVRLGDT